MKKFLSLMLVLCGVLILAACTGIPGLSDHTHEVNPIWRFDKESHWRTCDGCDELFEKTSHSFSEWEVISEPTELLEGKKERQCFCGYKETENIAVLEHVHEYTWETQSDATCTEAEVEVGSCRCGETTTREGDAALGHTEEVIPAVASTCTGTGLTEGKKCSVCNEVLVAQEEVPALGHNEVVDQAVASTCTKTGLTEGKHCSVCDEVLVAQEEVAALGHTEVVDQAVAATCTKTGLTEGKHCSVCDTVLVVQEEVAALGHKEADPVETNRVASTCTVAGSYDLVVKCSVCDEELSKTTEELPLASHTEEVIPALAPTCEGTGLTAGKKCSVCNEVLEAQEEVVALGHTEEIVPAVAPTCEATGLTEGKKCSVCGEVLVVQEEVAALGHDWNDGVVEGKIKTYTCGTCESTKTSNMYDIIWNVEGDETVLTLEEGSVIAYTGDTPVKSSSVSTTYHFAGWSDVENGEVIDLGLAEADVTYYAIFSEEVREYQLVVNYLDSEGQPFAINEKTSSTQTFAYGSRVDQTNSKQPKIEGYVASNFWFRFDVNEVQFDNLIDLEQIEMNVTYSPTAVWDGSVAESFAGGSGTEEDPYLISTGSHLAYLATLNNAVAANGSYGSGLYFSITNNIDLNNLAWTPIGYNASSTKYRYFAGTLYGNNFIISGMNYDNPTVFGAGLFGGIKGRVTNLTVEGNINAAHRSGGLGYYLSSSAYLENIKTYVNITTTSHSGNNVYVGGLMGTTTSTSVIKNSSSYGDIVAAYNNVGGITGNISSTSVIENVTNYGNVYSTGSNVGGIAGNIGSNANIKNATNYGGVTGAGNVGGLFGYSNGSVSTQLYNYGNVTGAGNYVGGVVGNSYGTNNHISYATNYGAVTNTGDYTGGVIGKNTQKFDNATNYGIVTGTTNVGGILGGADGGSNILSELHNYGDVLGTGVVGGVIGLTKTTKSVTTLSNRGRVEGNDHVGGITGTMNAAAITDTVNYGEVVGTGIDAEGNCLTGGIVGNAYGTDCKISSSINYGNVTGLNHAGGVVGWLTQTLTDCENYGTIKSAYRAGGIVGTGVGAKVSNSANHGTISCLDTTDKNNKEIGGIIGGNTTSGSITGCTNYGEVIGNNAVGYIAGFVGNGSTVVDCTNEGKITTTLPEDQQKNVGTYNGQDNNPVVLYLTPSIWDVDNTTERYAAYFFVGETYTWVDMTDEDGDGIYEVTVPTAEEAYTHVIFCRMDGSTTENSWDNKWNQTIDLEIPREDMTIYTINSWETNSDGKSTGAWSSIY